MNIKEITLRGQSIAAAVLYENEAKGIAVYAAMRMDSREDDMASVPQFVIFMETDAEEGPSKPRVHEIVWVNYEPPAKVIRKFTNSQFSKNA